MTQLTSSLILFLTTCEPVAVNHDISAQVPVPDRNQELYLLIKTFFSLMEICVIYI